MQKRQKKTTEKREKVIETGRESCRRMIAYARRNVQVTSKGPLASFVQRGRGCEVEHEAK